MIAFIPEVCFIWTSSLSYLFLFLQDFTSLRPKKCYACSVSTEARYMQACYESQGGAVLECTALALVSISVALLKNVFIFDICRAMIYRSGCTVGNNVPLLQTS